MVSEYVLIKHGFHTENENEEEIELSITLVLVSVIVMAFSLVFLLRPSTVESSQLPSSYAQTFSSSVLPQNSTTISSPFPFKNPLHSYVSYYYTNLKAHNTSIYHTHAFIFIVEKQSSRDKLILIYACLV